ncbi:MULTISPECIES: hypothetical protein [unclassified Streptomyces]|uniref:hypothetical protein n=1 Tax=unclassified Streptomyces TaxID=2593676 RepID=UPI001488F04D|nr:MULTISPECIES: hypothetical protein [unclassified Streptomyces]
MTDPTAADQNRKFLTTLANLGIATHRLDQIRDAARLHRKQLIGLSELYAVIDADAAAEQTPATNRAALRDRIAEALYERERPPRDPHWADAYAADREVFEAMADAVLAVLPEPADVLPEAADRGAVLREGADRLDAGMERFFAKWPDEPRNSPYALGQKDAAAELRRMADETPAAADDGEGDELVCVDMCGNCDACGMEPFGTPAEGWREAARYLRRTARESGNRAASLYGAQVIEAELRRMADEAQQQETDADVVEAHRLALSFALGLGTSAPWDAIRERAAELHGAEAQPTETDDTVHACPGRWGGPDCRCFDTELADEAQQQPDTETPADPKCVCGHPTRLHHEDACLLSGCGCGDCLETSALPEALEAVLTKRFTELGNQFAEMRVHEQGPDGWPASRLVSPRMVAEVLRELLAAGRGADGRPELRLPDHTVNEEEAPDAERPDEAAEAWTCKCPAEICGCAHHSPAAGARQDGAQT